MRKLVLLVVAFLMLSGVSFATWEDAASKGLIPFWQSSEVWYTMVVFVSGSETDYDIIYLRFCNSQGNFCSDIHMDMFHIRPCEQIMISTRIGVGYAMLVTAGSGYMKFRFEDGTPIQVYALIYNEISAMGAVVPSYSQEHGF